MDQFISKEVLDILSYHSTLGRSLKQISLRKTPLPIILDDIEKYRASYIDTIFQENLRRIQLKYNFGAERIIYLTYGVINMYINIKIQK